MGANAGLIHLAFSVVVKIGTSGVLIYEEYPSYTYSVGAGTGTIFWERNITQTNNEWQSHAFVQWIVTEGPLNTTQAFVVFQCGCNHFLSTFDYHFFCYFYRNQHLAITRIKVNALFIANSIFSHQYHQPVFYWNVPYNFGVDV